MGRILSFGGALKKLVVAHWSIGLFVPCPLLRWSKRYILGWLIL